MLFQLALHILHVVKLWEQGLLRLTIQNQLASGALADGVGGSPSKPLPPVTTLPQPRNAELELTSYRSSCSDSPISALQEHGRCLSFSVTCRIDGLLFSEDACGR